MVIEVEVDSACLPHILPQLCAYSSVHFHIKKKPNQTKDKKSREHLCNADLSASSWQGRRIIQEYRRICLFLLPPLAFSAFAVEAARMGTAVPQIYSLSFQGAAVTQLCIQAH